MYSKKTRPTIEEVETYVWGFVVVMVTLILCFIVIALLYSVTFVTQPIKSMAPIDMAYTKMLNDIVLLIVGGIGGVIGKKGVGTALNAFKQPSEPPPAPPPVVQASVAPSVASTNYNWMGFKNADLDESWTPPPPPTTPPDLLENDQDRELLAMARKEVS
tara:strand:- start:174 stop:653 length:480 start_codon:yes stop_codon:yes gene_type:complete